MTIYPAILGIEGKELTADERALFSEKTPLGFILFRRNIDTPQQVKELVQSLRALTGRADTPILIDQEGGRVQRLKPPHWVDLPSARTMGDFYRNQSNAGPHAIQLHSQAIAGMLAELGINVVCAPDIDVPTPDAHPQIMGDRTWGDTVADVTKIGLQVTETLLAHGITPVVKHVPGHGRATVDSHYGLPFVEASEAELMATDFAPFIDICKKVGGASVWGMTAHLVMHALDELPVSVSQKATNYCREKLGLTGPLIPDAVEMDALGGTLAERAVKTLQAGCDATMHCSGKFADIKDIMTVLPTLTAEAAARFAAAEQARIKNAMPVADWRASFEELTKLLVDAGQKQAETTFDHAAFIA